MPSCAVFCVARRNCAGSPSRKSASALPDRAVVDPVNVKSPFGRFTKLMTMCSWRTSRPNFVECRAGHPGHVVGELRHLVQPADERLLRVADAEEAGDGDVRQPGRDRDVLRHVDPVVAVRQPARGLRRGADPVVREPRHVDQPRREDVRVRGHHVLQRRLRDGSDRAGRRRRDRVGLAAQVPHEQRVASAIRL